VSVSSESTVAVTGLLTAPGLPVAIMGQQLPSELTSEPNPAPPLEVAGRGPHTSANAGVSRSSFGHGPSGKRSVPGSGSEKSSRTDPGKNGAGAANAVEGHPGKDKGAAKEGPGDRKSFRDAVGGANHGEGASAHSSTKRDALGDTGRGSGSQSEGKGPSVSGSSGRSVHANERRNQNRQNSTFYRNNGHGSQRAAKSSAREKEGQSSHSSSASKVPSATPLQESARTPGSEVVGEKAEVRAMQLSAKDDEPSSHQSDISHADNAAKTREASVVNEAGALTAAVSVLSVAGNLI